MNSFLTTIVVKVLVLTGIGDQPQNLEQKKTDISETIEQAVLFDEFRDLKSGIVPFQPEELE